MTDHISYDSRADVIPVPGEWIASAACTDEPWLADLDRYSSRTRRTRAARVCASCPVLATCKTWASTHTPDSGTWGGEVWHNGAVSPMPPPKKRKPARKKPKPRPKAKKKPRRRATVLPATLAQDPGRPIPAKVSTPILEAEEYARVHHGMSREELLDTLVGEAYPKAQQDAYNLAMAALSAR